MIRLTFDWLSSQYICWTFHHYGSTRPAWVGGVGTSHTSCLQSDQRHEFLDLRLLTATILYRTAQSSHPRSWFLRRPIVSILPYSLPNSLPGPDYRFNGRSLAMLSPPLLLHNGPATLSWKLCVPHAPPEGSYRPCKADRVLFLLPGANKPIRISIPQCFEDLLTPDRPIFILQCA